MKNTNLLALLERWNFEYKPHKDKFQSIGDVTAIRYEKGVPFRRNYERAMLVYAAAATFNCKNFVEFGTGRGYVTACVSSCPCIESIVTIDCVDSARSLIKKTQPDTIQKVKFIIKKSQGIEYNELPPQIDLAFIDGEHSHKAAKNDFELVMSRTKIVIFDDFRNKHKGVKKYIKSITDFNKLLVSTDGWIYKNKMIKKHKDADSVVDGREYKSGQVIVSKDEI